jgi:hypothetical protein
MSISSVTDIAGWNQLIKETKVPVFAFLWDDDSGPSVMAKHRIENR